MFRSSLVYGRDDEGVMSELICGLQVVRKPGQAVDSLRRGAYASDPPVIRGVTYGGIDRLPWFELDDAYFTGTLPARMEEIWRDVHTTRDHTGLDLCRDLAVSFEVLRWSGLDRNELIALRGRQLTDIKGVFALPPSHVQWRGFDVVALGEFSLLAAGVFRAPNHFSRWTAQISAHGLFSTAEQLSQYVDDYNEAAAKGIVESLSDESYKVDFIEIGGVTPQLD
jgi:hypothetical protein